MTIVDPFTSPTNLLLPLCTGAGLSLEPDILIPASAIEFSRQLSTVDDYSLSASPASEPDLFVLPSTENIGIDPGLLVKSSPVLSLALPVRKRKRIMSDPEGSSEQHRQLRRFREGRLVEMLAGTMPEGRHSPSPATQPRYPRIFNSTESDLASPSSTSATPAHGTSAANPVVAHHRSFYQNPQYLSVPGAGASTLWTTPTASYPELGSRSFQKTSPAELHRTVSDPAYAASSWVDPNPGYYNEPSRMDYNPSPSANSTYAGDTQFSADFSPQNHYATMQPLQHRSTFPLYGTLGNSTSSCSMQEQRQPQPLARSSTLPAPTSHPTTDSEAHTEQIISNVIRAQSAASDRSRRPSASRSPLPHTTITPGPVENSPDPSTVASATASAPFEAGTDADRQRPRCWEHNCNGREFSTFSNLLRHQRERSGVSQKSSCPTCGAEFTRTTARNAHLRAAKCTPSGDGGLGRRGGSGRGTSTESLQ